MPRQRKPPGYERWTWAEINAGRRMNKSEKRWRRVAKELNWDQRPDGNYVAPPHAQPILFIIIALMVVLGVLAPNGLDNMSGASGGVVVAALIVFLLLAGAMLLLVLVGANEPPARRHTGSGSTTDPVPLNWSSGESTTRSESSNTASPYLVDELQISVEEPQAPRQTSGGMRGLVGAIIGLLSFRWVHRLPDWFQPII